MLNEELLIINRIPQGKDADGFNLPPEEHEDKIFCSVRSAGVTEHYEAAKAGIEANYVFNVDTDSFQSVMAKYGKKYGIPDGLRYDGYDFNVVSVRPYRERYGMTQIVGDVVHG